jgi:hypothetical protein
LVCCKKKHWIQQYSEEALEEQLVVDILAFPTAGRDEALVTAETKLWRALSKSVLDTADDKTAALTSECVVVSS